MPSWELAPGTTSPGRHCHSTLLLTIIGCHSYTLRDSHSSLAFIAVMFHQNDRAAHGQAPPTRRGGGSAGRCSSPRWV